MKLLYLIEDFSVKGGAERIISLKANALCSMGHEVTIVSVYHDERPPSYPLAEGVSLVSLDVPFARSPLHRLSTLFTIWRRLNRVLKQQNPDIVFFTMVVGALLLPFVNTRASRVYESHSARPFTPYHRLFGLMERRANAVVCLTGDDAREWRHCKHPAMVITNFVEDHSAIRPDYSVKRAIAVGRLEYEKGFDVLIRAWKRVSEHFADWTLDIYGEGSERDKLQAQIDAAGLQGVVTLCGRDENIFDRYAEHSVGISSSRYEGLNLTLVEAASCSLPLVSTRFKYGVHDIITDGKNGFISDLGDDEDLAKAIMRLLSSESLRREMGVANREVAMRFSKEVIMRQWEELIQRLSNC